MEVRYCRKCRKEITDPDRKNYCSIECNPNYRGIQGVSVICKNCGNEFKRKTIKQMFCSRECRVTYSHEHPRTGENAGHWQGGKIAVSCDNCGKEIKLSKYKLSISSNHFCSRTCKGQWLSENRTGDKASNWRGGNYVRNCVVCGKEFEVLKYIYETNTGGKCCSNECRYKLKSLQMTGEGNHRYENGSSYYPYCEKFNREFKRRVRDFFGNKCMLCGKTEEENRAKMTVHHVYANKMACCDTTERRFATVCRSCHNTITNYERYNKEKLQEYIDKLNEIIDTQYNGKCYYTKEEYYANIK